MNKQHTLNLIGDLDRAVMFYVQDPTPSYQNCPWLQNITHNLYELQKIDSKVPELIDVKYLRSDSDPPLVKAEHLLMMSLRLQHYLGL